MGWVMLAAIGIATVALLWLLGVPRTLWMFAGAAVMLGATGYALQGSPMLPGHPVSREAEIREIDQGLLELRHQMFGHITFANAYLVASDALARAGRTRSAVSVVLGGIRHSPRDIALWTGLGLAYTEHDDGYVSPAARMAFEHAIELAPGHPGPPFFYGMALVRAGEFAAARPYWQRAVQLAPKDAKYRDGLRLRLQLLDQFLAAENGNP
ncbi:tetratricopeptide repeat protein [Stakelama marina]|uniref:Tetratricopeptide repeat protein n=1 Tax=Stakelama marina TaxID=2826939 RepID=A0A8T4IBL3_9SPHN|nr:hypothetical protein [Stakelama marina]MBR0551950.1 hypothetical protein [Stakelama marina]